MALQLSVVARNAELDAIETAIGVSAVLKLLTGAIPANCAAADSGTVLATLNLPSDYFSNAAAGSKAFLGTWQDGSADASGLAGYFRLYASGGATCHMQGLAGQNWAATTSYLLNQQVINDTGKCYKCTLAGTSAASGGPTGTGTGIVDGSAHWDYIGTVDVTLDQGNFNAGQVFNITGFTLTAANS